MKMPSSPTGFSRSGALALGRTFKACLLLCLLCATLTPQTPVERPELILQTGHSEKTEALAFSPNGRLVATGSSDRTIKLWDAANGHELRALNASTGIKALAFSPNGQMLAAGGNDGKLRLWNVATGLEQTALTGHTKSVLALAYSADGRWLASGGADEAVKVWDLAAQREHFSLNGPGSWVLALAFSPNGQTLVAGGLAGTLKFWETTTGGAVRTLNAHRDRVRCLAFNASGTQLASGGNDGQAILWDARSGQSLNSFSRLNGSVVTLAFTANDTQLLTATNEHTLQRFALANGNVLATLPEAENLNRYEAAAFSPDGQRLAACDGTRDVTVRGTAPTPETLTLASRINPVKAIAVSPDGRWFATGNQDTSITWWEMFSGRAVATVYGNTGSVNALAFAPDSQTLASGSNGGVIKVWDVLAARELKSWTAHADGVNALVYSPDGQRLYSASTDASIKSWDAANARPLATLAGHQSEVYALSLSRDGQRLLSASADQTAKLWNLAANTVIRNFTSRAGALFAAALSADGQTVALGGTEGMVKLLNAATGNEIRTLKANGQILNLSFSPDGQTLAACAGPLIQLWQTQDWQPRATLAGHSGTINAVGFSSFNNEDQWLVSGSDDGSARLWQLSNQTLAATFAAIRNSNDWIVVTPDGLFDGSPAAWQQILWRFNRNTFNAAPVELFFNDFFYPELLADILGGKRPPPKENLTLLDRRQPRVKLTGANETLRSFKVRLEITEAPPDRAHPQGSGAQDVRLFRNGSLVKRWRGDVLKGQSRAVLEAEVPLIAGENQLTAYAFNRANVKSSDAHQRIVGGPTLDRRGTAYVIAVGINQYSNPSFNLKFAVADALSFSTEWVKQQTALNRFAHIEPVLLIDQQATKANLLAALQRLGSDARAALGSDAPAALQKLNRAQPEDAVILFFAGHGMALDQRFYLLAHELGYQGNRAELTEAAVRNVLPLAISDEELEGAFENIDAAHLLMVLDACNSGQALEAEEQRRGPMNTKGLAQLAYEKGMNILTAAQSYQSAQEAATLGHGYLTFALIEDGLKRMSADQRPQDGQLVLREWLDYATAAVPQMQAARVNAETGAKRGLVKTKLQRLREIQRPRVFYRREVEAQPLLIGKQ
jgi:WD40 repeat protein